MSSFKTVLYGRMVVLQAIVLLLICFGIYRVTYYKTANQVKGHIEYTFKDLTTNTRDVDNVKTTEKGYCAPPIGGYKLNMSPRTATCQIPKLDPFHPIAMKTMQDVQPIRCSKKQRATLSGGMLNITGKDVAYAAYRYITRPEGDDFKFQLSSSHPVSSSYSPVPHEYIQLTLKLTNGGELKEYMMQAFPRQDIKSRPSLKSELDLNILIIGIDSISNGHAQRKLPKSYNYIQKVLQGYMFMGNSAVGDGTTEQLAAFLTGRGEQEYAESRRGQPNAKPVDDWNWIFKKAKEHGYVTSFGEDTPSLGAFHFRLLGFENPPTDYYPRVFFLAGDEGRIEPHCYGSKKIFQYHLDFPMEIFRQYPKRRKFLLHFASEISHGNFNNVQEMDNDLLQFLTEFNTRGYLNNTLLIVLGDHGWRYGAFRQSVHGKLEERLPLFSMTFPKWFKQKYPELAKNLKTNTERLTSWFDLYATFRHILEYPNTPKDLKHGMSLLTEVPLERSCKDASIPQHWCPCVQWTAVNIQHEHIQAAALSAVNHINNRTFRERLGAERCTELKLDKVIRAEIETPTAHVLRFEKSGHDGYDPIYSEGKRIERKDHCNYQITFMTSPNNGMFEAIVHFANGRFLVKGSISRINKYGDQPKCIGDLVPHLRAYCYCKTLIKNYGTEPTRPNR